MDSAAFGRAAQHPADLNIRTRRPESCSKKWKDRKRTRTSKVARLRLQLLCNLKKIKKVETMFDRFADGGSNLRPGAGEERYQQFARLPLMIFSKGYDLAILNFADSVRESFNMKSQIVLLPFIYSCCH